MTTDTPRTEAIVEQMAAGKGASDLIALARELERERAALADRFASIAERMGLDAESDEAKRLAVEIGAAIRSEVA